MTSTRDPALVWTIADPRVDGAGIHASSGNAPSIHWDAVTRVALGYEIHPTVIYDFDFWSFQSGDPNTMVRVVTTFDDEVTAEVRRRYGNVDVPPMKDWADAGRDVCTYVIWPPEDVGKSLYTLDATDVSRAAGMQEIG